MKMAGFVCIVLMFTAACADQNPVLVFINSKKLPYQIVEQTNIDKRERFFGSGTILKGDIDKDRIADYVCVIEDINTRMKSVMILKGGCAFSRNPCFILLNKNSTFFSGRIPSGNSEAFLGHSELDSKNLDWAILPGTDIISDSKDSSNVLFINYPGHGADDFLAIYFDQVTGNYQCDRHTE